MSILNHQTIQRRYKHIEDPEMTSEQGKRYAEVANVASDRKELMNQIHKIHEEQKQRKNKKLLTSNVGRFIIWFFVFIIICIWAIFMMNTGGFNLR